jgi:phosphate transport system ATP-binding protein
MKKAISEPITSENVVLEALNVEVRVRERAILQNISLRVASGEILSIIGPSGAGKSTLLRCFNRLSELNPAIRVDGDVRLMGSSIYAPGLDVNVLRARVGMLFQEPVVFPADIRENVLFGAKRLRKLSKEEQDELVESKLREVALWEEVRDRLKQPANNLSVGQQQRLCLARTLAVQPEVLLMDEPTSALDPRSTSAIEELLLEMKSRHSIVLVTHNLRQARQISDRVAVVCQRNGVGQIVEQGVSAAVFASPSAPEFRDYLGQTTGI